MEILKDLGDWDGWDGILKADRQQSTVRKAKLFFAYALLKIKFAFRTVDF